MIEFDPFAEEWVAYARNPSYSLVEKCLKLSQCLEFQSLDIGRYVAEINSFGRNLREHVPEGRNPAFLVSMLNEYMFDKLGFEGNRDDYYNPRNNFLNTVIDTRKGIPITLSILYIQLGNYIGLDLRPVGFPSHFLVKNSEELILDPFNGGIRLEKADLDNMLKNTYGNSIKFNPEYLNEIEPRKILIRIARNLKSSYMQSFNYGMAMHCINMVLGLEPEDPEETRDLGILQARLLQNGKALDSLNRYLELSPEADDVDYVLDLIREIRDKASR